MHLPCRSDETKTRHLAHDADLLGQARLSDEEVYGSHDLAQFLKYLPGGNEILPKFLFEPKYLRWLIV